MEIWRNARLWLSAGLAGLAGLAILHAWVPSTDAAGAICLSRRLFHLPCPGCGMTRAFAHLAKGEWSAAEMIGGWALWGLALARRRPLRLPVPLDTLFLANAALLCALWLGRAATGTLPW